QRRHLAGLSFCALLPSQTIPRELLPVPTRRSSDLAAAAADEANAIAVGGIGAGQIGLPFVPSADVTLDVTNSATGSIAVSGIANATGVTTANAFAVGGVGLAQAGFGADVDISASNAGLIDVAATANASADEANASALAGIGVIQAGIAGNTATITTNIADVSLTNASGGSILVG